MKIQIEMSGFTPLLDSLVQEYKGPVTAAVYGAIWRYAQMKDGVCRASMAKIAQRVGMSPKTAERHCKTLCNDGYLIDMTPEVRNIPHTYAVTGKAELAGKIEATRSDRESYQGKSESRTRSDRESYQGKSESPKKIHDKDTIKDIGKISAKADKQDFTQAERDELNKWAEIVRKGYDGTIANTAALELVVILTRDIAGFTNTDRVASCATSLKALVSQAVRLHTIPNVQKKWTSFEGWWPSTWLGKTGQQPSVKQVGDNWGQFEQDTVGPQPGGVTLSDAKKARLAELSA